MDLLFEHVSYRYPDGAGLVDVNLRIRAGVMTAILGAPGSGKSTLLQHMNGLLLPNSGEVRIGETRLHAGSGHSERSALRRRVGLVFQYPEQQLFEETVAQDLRFGPLNFGQAEAEAEASAERAAHQMGLDATLLARSPWQLSSGERRRAAVAAVLASDPEIIVLDEPTASLDAAGRRELMSLLGAMCRDEGKTIVIATHRIEEVAPYAADYAVLHEGGVLYAGDGASLMQRPDVLEQAGVLVPPGSSLASSLTKLTGDQMPGLCPEPAQLARALHESLQRRRMTCGNG
ncbi:ATP-binding cassette domain-containing protein [Paenibacillus sp. 598K]|uniref:ATP-binding cassette domain-containing protein n=1 Tax=Paenibacillus sp. 598K TaxID=1117987 RepID=UPI000FFEB4CC|nr:ATP-binding cassette domain-containing protein [Paenibacillus sp. 598K]